MSIESQSVEFIPLINHDDFEISTTYPFTIRDKDNHCEISEFTDNIAVNLNNNLHYIVNIEFVSFPKVFNFLLAFKKLINIKKWKLTNLYSNFIANQFSLKKLNLDILDTFILDQPRGFSTIYH